MEIDFLHFRWSAEFKFVRRAQLGEPLARTV
eukprot:COSAG05_NODE_25986_length_191_cov_20689.597826_1_plen_30_part_10